MSHTKFNKSLIKKIFVTLTNIEPMRPQTCHHKCNVNYLVIMKSIMSINLCCFKKIMTKVPCMYCLIGDKSGTSIYSNFQGSTAHDHDVITV